MTYVKTPWGVLESILDVNIHEDGQYYGTIEEMAQDFLDQLNPENLEALKKRFKVTSTEYYRIQNLAKEDRTLPEALVLKLYEDDIKSFEDQFNWSTMVWRDEATGGFNTKRTETTNTITSPRANICIDLSQLDESNADIIVGLIKEAKKAFGKNNADKPNRDTPLDSILFGLGIHPDNIKLTEEDFENTKWCQGVAETTISTPWTQEEHKQAVRLAKHLGVNTDQVKHTFGKGYTVEDWDNSCKDWGQGKLGNDERYVKHSRAPKSLMDALDGKSEMNPEGTHTLVSVRLPNELLDYIKTRARNNGVGHVYHIQKILEDYVASSN